MKEIEVKIPIDYDKYISIRELLTGGSDSKEKDLYFQTNQGTLRIREDNTGAYVTCKGPKVVVPGSLVTSREEVNIRIRDVNEWTKVFNLLGFTPLASVEKYRISYDVMGTTICLDSILGLGFFVEIEAIADVGQETEALCKINHVRRYLGLEDAKAETRGYLDMLLEKQ